MEGRLGRQGYLIVSFGLYVICYVVAFVIGFGMGMGGASEDAAGAVGGVVGLAFSIPYAFAAVKRLHDLDRPGWHYWLLLVPLYNLYLAMVMLFKKGTAGPNQFGNDPTMSGRTVQA